MSKGRRTWDTATRWVDRAFRRNARVVVMDNSTGNVLGRGVVIYCSCLIADGAKFVEIKLDASVYLVGGRNVTMPWSAVRELTVIEKLGELPS